MITYNKIKSKTLENIYPIRILKKKKKLKSTNLLLHPYPLRKEKKLLSIDVGWDELFP